MENLRLVRNMEMPYLPEVDFDANAGICDISGESYMDDTYKFYLPLLNWIEEYLESSDILVFNFKLTYFNTSSSKCILDILELLKKRSDIGKNISINWYYDKADPEMINDVEDFQIETGADIVLIES